MFETKPDPAFSGFRLLRIDSSGWKHVPGLLAFWNPVLENPQRDVWEVRLPDGTLEQMFTHAAALREVANAGLKLPSAKDLTVAASMPKDGSAYAEIHFQKGLSGFWHLGHRTFYDQKANAYRWIHLETDSRKGHKTFPAIRNGGIQIAEVKLPSTCAVPVAVE